MHGKFKYILIFVLVLISFKSYSSDTSLIDTSAKQGILIDFNTGQKIISKNANELMKPASMGKLMTIYIAFEKIKNKQFSLKDKFIVSEKAWKKRGSRTFLEPGQSVSLKNLLMGVIVQSGNDAAIVLAEGISGTEENFANLMNSFAREIGMKNTIFTNSTGWPDKNQNTTAEDLALLSQKLIQKFPDLYKMFSEISFTFNGIKQGNRNPILYNNLVFGADGLKTGHTQESGYGLVGSAIRNNLRFILVLNGLSSQKHRKEEAARLLNFAFREYKSINFFKKNENIIEAKVWLGKKNRVFLKAGKEINLLLNSLQQRDVKVYATWNDPLFAPLIENQEVGSIEIKLSDNNVLKYPLYVSESVNKDSILNRITSKIDYFIWGSVR